MVSARVSANTLTTLQAGRAFAAICVLLFHVNVTLSLEKYIGKDIFPIFNAGNSGVHYFFVLSGFVIYLAHEKDIGRPEALRTFFIKRVRRVYAPLWIVLLPIAAAALAIPSLGLGPVSLSSVISALLILPAEREWLLSVEWTLRHEVLFYLIFGLAIWRPRIGTPLALIWIVLSMLPIGIELHYPWSFYFSSYHVLFAFGAGAAFAFKRGYDRGAIPSLVVGVVLFSCTWFSSIMFVENKDIANIFYGLGATLIIFGAAILEKRGVINTPGFLLLLGEASYSIYLVHYPVISIVCKVMKGLNLFAPKWEIGVFLLLAIFSLCAGVAFHLFIERPVLRLLTQHSRKGVPSAESA